MRHNKQVNSGENLFSQAEVAMVISNRINVVKRECKHNCHEVEPPMLKKARPVSESSTAAKPQYLMINSVMSIVKLQKHIESGRPDNAK
uniref:Ovule protein n=1 Tax=Steinernema glaseri TaxID=37863 RepID=A0A1I8AL32_9BILA